MPRSAISLPSNVHKKRGQRLCWHCSHTAFNLIPDDYRLIARRLVMDPGLAGRRQRARPGQSPAAATDDVRAPEQRAESALQTAVATEEIGARTLLSLRGQTGTTSTTGSGAMLGGTNARRSGQIRFIGSTTTSPPPTTCCRRRPGRSGR